MVDHEIKKPWLEPDLVAGWTIGVMVLILDGNSEHVAQASMQKVFSEKKIRFNEMLLAHKKTENVLTCAPISELPSHRSTMIRVDTQRYRGPPDICIVGRSRKKSGKKREDTNRGKTRSGFR